MDISVIIPVYNAEKYVSKAVDSALQFAEVKEVILVEDASPDNALELCQRLEKEHQRVHLYQHPNGENKGAGASRNLGIEKATQEFIAFLDADDYYLPNRFEAEKELFQKPEVEGVYGALGVDYYTEKAKEQNFSIFGNQLDTIYKKADPKDVFPGQMYLKGSFGLIHLDTLTVRRKSLGNWDLKFNETLRLHQDTDFTIRLSYYLNLFPGSIDQTVAMRGVHEENRITQVESQKINPASTRVLLWKALKEWSELEETMPENYKVHIRNMYQSFQIANSSFPQNYILFFQELVTHFPAAKSGLYNINYRKELFPFL